MVFVPETAENTVGKEENGGNQCLLLFPQCFQIHKVFLLPQIVKT